MEICSVCGPGKILKHGWWGPLSCVARHLGVVGPVDERAIVDLPKLYV